MPTFKKVHIDGLENLNTFVEFNDDKQFLVVIDTEGGRLSRLSLMITLVSLLDLSYLHTKTMKRAIQRRHLMELLC